MDKLFLVVLITIVFQYLSNVLLTFTRLNRNNIQYSPYQAFILPTYITAIMTIWVFEELSSPDTARKLLKIIFLAYNLPLIATVVYTTEHLESNLNIKDLRKDINFRSHVKQSLIKS